MRAESLAPHHNGDTSKQADGDAASRADPVIFKSEFEEIRDSDQQSSDADSVEPVRADPGFEVGFRLS